MVAFACAIDGLRVASLPAAEGDGCEKPELVASERHGARSHEGE
jgi:hypothetical protein